MPRYRITTLVDITRTNAARSEPNELKSSQQANFNSLIQAIGMRSNVDWQSDPEKHEGRLPSPWQGKAVYWIWEFDVERDEIFDKDGDPVALLKEDLNGVPIIVGLEESSDLEKPAFITLNGNTNTRVEII